MDWLSNIFATLWSYVRRALRALRHLNFTEIWHAMQRVYDYYCRFRTWWKKYIEGPIEAYRKFLLGIYRQFFAPIIGVLDLVRSVARIIGIFNRKLAAKLDAAIWKVEGWILKPITIAMRRINGIASIVYAIITITGRFDATVFVRSVERHIHDLHAALLGLPWKSTKPLGPDSLTVAMQARQDFLAWVQTESGPIQDRIEAMDPVFQQSWDLLGGSHGG
jgi:hypothetical protein